jgi:penicillin-binding protein 2
MRKEPDWQKVCSRRAALLAGGKLALLSALAGRLYYLQIIEGDRYSTLAEDNRINLLLLPPPRGRIVDRRGVELARNRQNYRAVIIPENTTDLGQTLERLGRIVPLSEADRRRIMREARMKRGFVPVTVRENLGWEEVARIEVNSPYLPGVMIDVGQSRHYPFNAVAAHVVGYVATVTEKEITGDPLLELPGFRVGRSGIESAYDLALRGKAGSSQVEVNALGRVIRELSRKEGEPGGQVSLTLDAGLQKFANDRLKGKSTAAVVLEVHSGEVLAMVSTPGFDPNAFNRGMSVETWKELISNPLAPLINKPVVGQYAPGSTFKMMVALAALESGEINPSQTFYCPGFLDLGDRRFHCWKRGGHGAMNMREAIKQSCDVYFYEISPRVGIDRIAEMSRRFGLGERLNIELPGERPGLIPTRGWKKKAIGVPWQKGETLVSAIGQGHVLTTPLQLAVMTARLVNGGYAVTPRIVHTVGSAPSHHSAETADVMDGKSSTVAPEGMVENSAAPERQDPTGLLDPPSSIGVSKAALEFVFKAMVGVTNEPQGTAYASRITNRRWWMGGKTGTSQVRAISLSERKSRKLHPDELLPWKERDHALFIGFAPVHAPRYAVAVVIEHGGSGAKSAAPVARDLLLVAQRRRLGERGSQQTATDQQRS